MHDLTYTTPLPRLWLVAPSTLPYDPRYVAHRQYIPYWGFYACSPSAGFLRVFYESIFG
jgi:hypothetical protein